MGIVLLSFTTLIMAKDIDINKAKGINQDVIVSLTPAPAQTDVSQDVTIKAVFDVDLDAQSVKKNDIKLKHITQTKESIIDGSVGYLAEEKAVTFKSKQELEEGYYEIEFKSLKATKEEKDKQFKEIKYRFAVIKQEIINGYTLPPEPNPAVNNATLLGVDSNDNGIRDDVEIYIIKRFAQYPQYSKTKTAIALQYAWASQKILESPTMESKKYIDDALDCESYWIDTKTKHMSGFEYVQYSVKHGVFNNPEIKDKIYNTRTRISQKFSFNATLSGNIFDGRDESIDNCRTNIDMLGE